MKIELKNVKYAQFASQETNCFEATVYIDGKKATTVDNDGHGGPNNWGDWDVQKKISAFAAETIPPTVCDWDDPNDLADADTIIDDLLVKHLESRDLKRLLASRVVFIDDGKIYQSAKLPAPRLRQYLADEVNVKRVFKTDTVLNLLPFDRALDLYLRHAA